MLNTENWLTHINQMFHYCVYIQQHNFCVMTLYPCSSPPLFTHVALLAYIPLWLQFGAVSLLQSLWGSPYFSLLCSTFLSWLLFLTCLFQPHYFSHLIHSPHALLIILNTFITAICIHCPFILLFHTQDSSACTISYCIIPCLDWLVCLVLCSQRT